jgi:thiol-disulfide isomerase/thioredoxin
MGADGVFVHLAEQYYMKNKAYWLDSTQNAKIQEKALRLKPLLIGKIAPNISMYDLKSQPISLHDVKSKYTAVYFWDPDCGHCQKVTPVLKNKSDTLKTKGLTVFGVCMEPDPVKVKTNVEKYKIENWTNVNDPYNTSGYRKFYDISSTPQLFLLNEKKEIIAKQITPEQLEEIINNLK